MKKTLSVAAILGLIAVVAILAGGDRTAADDWQVKATFIEACSCPMFCQCFFNNSPAGHGGHGGHGDADATHFCKFNIAAKIDDGHHGDTKLDDVKFWIAGDLGSDFAEGKMDWAVLTFDKASTPEQRAGVQAFIGSVFAVEWADFRAGEGTISWKASGGTAHATLDGGKTAEVKLANSVRKHQDDKPTVIHNLAYWWAKSNEGFVLMPSEVEAWRGDERAFEFNGSNGFMVTVHADSTAREGG